MTREEAIEVAIVHVSSAIMKLVESNDGPWQAWSHAEAAKFIVESGVGNP